VAREVGPVELELPAADRQEDLAVGAGTISVPRCQGDSDAIDNCHTAPLETRLRHPVDSSAACVTKVQVVANLDA
jgi:hypothetical protein